MAGYRSPTTEQVRELLRRIPTSQLRRAFFEGLKNPHWVEPLAREGAFRNPPEPEHTDDGLIRDVYWPEIEYLVRVVSEVPAAVVDVLLKLRKSNNAWVRRGAFTIGAKIPATEAARMKPLIQAWASSGLGWRSDPREMVDMAVNLLSGGEYDVGKWFADVLFKPGAPKGDRKPRVMLDEFWYEEGLPRVVAVLGDDGLAVVLPWLVAYERHSGRKKGGRDLTSMVRDTIKTRGNTFHSVEEALIDAVRDVAVKELRVNPGAATEMLLATDMILSRQIALFALAAALTDRGDGEPDEMLGVARDLLLDADSLEESCRTEYGSLSRAVASLTGEPLEGLSEILDDKQRSDDLRLRQRLGGDEAEHGDVDSRIQRYHERWMHRWLATIGEDALPDAMRSRLTELDARFGEIASPLEPDTQITSWTGPSSPLSRDEMSLMSPTELYAHLESWHDTSDGWGPAPSHEGQGRELTELLTTNPDALAGVDDVVARLRPTYLRAILNGWQAALKAGLVLDWRHVTEVVREVLAHDDASPFAVEGREFDDDADFRGAKHAAVNLLEELAKKRSENLIPPEVMPIFADLLISAADDKVAWADYAGYDGDNGMDPLTVSLNWQWPVRIRGLVHLISHGQVSGWYTAARSALEVELARADSRGASRAVLGEGLGRLLSADEDWVGQEASTWFGDGFGSSANQQIATTTAMAVHYYHPKLYELLTPAMLGVIRSKAPIAGWRSQSDPLQRLGEWVTEAFIRGDKTLDDPVAQTFFAEVPAAVRGEAIGHIAWSFMHAERVHDQIRDRLANLWDARVEHVREHPDHNQELSGFYWFVKSGKFDATWWLPRLKEAVELNPSLSGERYMIGKEVATAADIDPRGAFDALRLLLEGRDEAGLASFDLTRNAVPMVLARAISSGDEDLARDATAFMHALGEQGNLQLESEVSAVLDGDVTQKDVAE